MTIPGKQLRQLQRWRRFGCPPILVPMTHSRPYPIRSRRWQQSVADVEVVEAGADLAVEAETRVAAANSNSNSSSSKLRQQPTSRGGTRAPSILTFPRASGRGASCTGNGAGLLISVRNQRPARGRIFFHQNNPDSNETGTSSAKNIMTKSTLSIAC